MPLIHIVLWRIRQDADSSTLQQCFDDLMKLKDLPGVVDLQIGPTALNLYPGYEDRTKGFTHCLYLKVHDADALEHYAKVGVLPARP
jgi:hypothetical protein